MARDRNRTAAKPVSDLEVWEENSLQGTLTHLPASYLLRASDLGLTRSYSELRDAFVNAEDKTTRDEAERIVRAVAWKVLTLMRLDSGLDFTDEMPNNWDIEELKAPNFGNDFTPCTNPANERGNKNTISPRPGNTYRNFCLNWEVVVARLHFWEPESIANLKADVIEKREKENHRRLQALKTLPRCDKLDAAWHKKFKQYTASLREEYEEAHKEAAKDLDDGRPRFTQAA